MVNFTRSKRSIQDYTLNNNDLWYVALITRAQICDLILRHYFLIVLGLLLLAPMPTLLAEDKKPRNWDRTPNYQFENNHLRFGIYLRTPEQMSAFYEGRGFPKSAIAEIHDTCFMTVVIRNYSKAKIWLDLADWKFFSEYGPVHRIDRNQWKVKWEQLKTPLANQSTFTWTLLPEVRDLHPDEPVGGNIIFSPIDYTFTIEANFKTGEDKQGTPLQVIVNNVKCEKNSNPK